MSHEHPVHVVIPDSLGLTVVVADDLLGYLAEGYDLEEAITNAGMDTMYDLDHVADHMDRIRRLNATGDARAYWDLDGGPEPEEAAGD